MNKIVITVNNFDNIQDYVKLESVERLLIGNRDFTNRLSNSFDISEISEASKIAHDNGKEIYVLVNRLFHQSEIDVLENYLKDLNELDIDGIVFSDFAVYEIAKRNKFDVKLTYSTDTTITNSYFTVLASEFDIEDVFLAKEITLKEIEEINSNKASKIGMFLHGHIYMYNSFRKLISIYLEAEEVSIENDVENGEFYLYDDERNNYYPIIETEHGTNILSADDQASFKNLKDILKIGIDYFIIDGFLYEDADYLLVLKLYNDLFLAYTNVPEEEFINMCNDKFNILKENILNKKFSNGFLKKETMF